MQTTTIRQRTIRLAGVTALTLGLALSASVATAMPRQSGLTECEYAGCAIISVTSTAQRSLADHNPAQDNSGGVYRPHLTR